MGARGEVQHVISMNTVSTPFSFLVCASECLHLSQTKK